MSKLQSLRVLSADTGSNTAGCDIADTCGSAASTSKATTSSRKRHASDFCVTMMGKSLQELRCKELQIHL